MEAFTVTGVVFDVSAGSVLLRCVGARSVINLSAEEYFAAKQGVAEARGIPVDAISFVGITLVLDDDGIPALPATARP